MNNLLQGKFAPITNTIGFLKCDHLRAAEAFLDWQRALQERRGVTVSKKIIHGDLSFTLEQLLPLTSVERRRFLFIPTNSPWTAFLDNGHQGTDVFSTISYLAKTISCEAVRATDIPEGQPKKYPALIFEIYGPSETSFLNYIRSVALSYNGKSWSFSASGDIQPFEDIQRYNNKMLKDRFTSEMLTHYLKAMGIEAYSPGYYVPNELGAVLIEKSGPIAPAAREFRLDEARLV